MKIAILSPADVSDSYGASLKERGHKVVYGPFGHIDTAVTRMRDERVDGVFILSDADEKLEQIAARFTRETGRPVWRNLTEIPR